MRLAGFRERRNYLWSMNRGVRRTGYSGSPYSLTPLRSAILLLLEAVCQHMFTLEWTSINNADGAARRSPAMCTVNCFPFIVSVASCLSSFTLSLKLNYRYVNECPSMLQCKSTLKRRGTCSEHLCFILYIARAMSFLQCIEENEIEYAIVDVLVLLHHQMTYKGDFEGFQRNELGVIGRIWKRLKQK